MSSTTKRVIIPKFTQSDSKEEYFVPRYVKIIKGDTVEWINTDTRRHTLVIHLIERDQLESIERIGPINPNQVARFKFDYQLDRIEYECGEHPMEQGTIVIFPKDENEMTNTERLRFLSRVFKFSPPSFLSHLGPQQDE